MTTDQLIDWLSNELEPVDRARIPRSVILSLAIGAAAAFLAMLLLHGLSNELFAGSNLNLSVIKLLFTAAVVATAAPFLPRYARPGAESRAFLALICLPFVAIAALALGALASSQWSNWEDMIVGPEWLTCLLSIPLFAMVPFAAVVWALRTGAPTDRVRAGAAAGLVAGGLSATACALACPDDSLPSIALWYGLAMAICAGLGAKLGPHLLRW